MMLVGMPRMNTARAHAERVREEVGEDAAREPADEHDVHDAHRDAEAAQPVRAHGLQHRRDHRERARGEHRLRDARGSRTTTTLCVETCSGVNSADGRISTPTITSALAGSLR